MKKRLFSLFLAMTMVMSLFSGLTVTAYAEESVVKVHTEGELLHAINDATGTEENPTVISLEENISLTSMLLIDEGKHIAINGNDKVITRVADGWPETGHDNLIKLLGTLDTNHLKFDANKCKHIVLVSGGQLNANDTTFTGAYNTNTYGAIGINNGGSMVMTGGAIYGNEAKDRIAVVADGGTFEMTDVKIYNNIAHGQTQLFVTYDKSGSGGICGKIVLNSGEIYNNKSEIEALTDSIRDDMGSAIESSYSIKVAGNLYVHDNTVTVGNGSALQRDYAAGSGNSAYRDTQGKYTKSTSGINITSPLTHNIVVAIYEYNEPTIERRTLLRGVDGYQLSEDDLAKVDITIGKWYTNETVYDKNDLIIALNKDDNTIEANAKAKITFKNKESTVESFVPKYVATALDNPFTAPAGKVFAGWEIEPGKEGQVTITDAKITTTTDVVLTAQWKDAECPCTAENPHIITTAAELSAIRDHVTTINGTQCINGYFKLANDIVFTDADFAVGGDFYNDGYGWLPIGKSSTTYAVNTKRENVKYFIGSFDGDGKSITGLKIDEQIYIAALFAGIDTDGVVKNLTLDSAIFYNNYKTGKTGTNAGRFLGGITAYTYGTIDNCHIKNCQFYSTGGIAGAIAGCVEGTVSNCTVDKTVLKSFSNTGVPVGNKGDKTGLITGMTGNTSDTAWIVNCTVSNSEVYGQSRGSGGIVGLLYGGTIEKCSVSKTTITNQHERCGGITGGNYAGEGRTKVIKNCSVTDCTIIGPGDAGGLVGYDSGSTLSYEITDCSVIDTKISVTKSTASVSALYAGTSATLMLTLRNCVASGVSISVSDDAKTSANTNISAFGYTMPACVRDISNNTIDVTINADSGYAGKFTSFANEYASGLYELPVLNRAGYYLVGWYEDAEFTSAPVTEPVADKIYYAKWTDGAPTGDYDVADISDQTYTGAPIQPKVTVTQDGVLLAPSQYTVSYPADCTNVDTKTVTVTITADSTELTKTLTKTYKIVKDNATTITVSNVNIKEGDTVDIAPVAKLSNGTEITDGTITVKYYDTAECSGEGFTTAPTAAGTYYAIATLTGTDNYAEATSTTAKITISGHTYTVEPVADNKTYTGAEIKPTFTVCKDGEVMDASAFTVTYPADCTNVGTKDVTISVDGKTLSSSYEVVQSATTVTVNSVSQTVNKDYNINPVAKLANGTVITDGITVKYYSDASCTTEIEKPTHSVGTYYAKATLAGTANYATKTSSAATIVLNAADVPAVNASGWEGPYDGEEHKISVTSEDSGVQITYSIDGKNFYSKEYDFIAAGTYTVYYKAHKDDCTDFIGTKQVIIGKVPTYPVSVVADKTTVKGGETVTLTVNIAKANINDKITIDGITCSDSSIVVTKVSEGVYTATIPENADKTYTFTVNASGDVLKNYIDGTAECTVTVPSGGSSGSSSKKPAVVVTNPTGGSATASNNGTVTITPNKGYEIDKVTVNGKEVDVPENGKLTGLKPSDKVNVTFKAGAAGEKHGFVDVADTDYYAKAVDWAAANGITGGVDATHFAPNADCTRAHMVAFLWRAVGCPEPKGDASVFVDVVSNSYYEKAVAWGIENGIVKGTSATTFSPDDIVTRGQAVTFLARMSGIDGKADSYNHSFTDVYANDYYSNAVSWAAEEGITSGTSESTFSPVDNCLRCQIVTFLYRYFVK